jgi:hypothetical protein
MQKIAREPGNRTQRGSWAFKILAAASTLLALSVLLTPCLMRAQLATADILGTITDSTGAVVPDAKVTVRNTGTGITSSTITNKVGEFLFSHVQIGTFKVMVEAKGFKNFTVNNLELTAGQRVRVNASLQVGSQVETVQVEASAAAELQTDSSDINATIDSVAMSEMPTNGRNYYNLIGLEAGMASGSAGGGPTDARQSMGFTANGQSAMFNNNMIDGMDNNERTFGSVAVEPSLDALQEVQVEASNYSAEYSRTAGGIANLITKSGTNAFHGSAFEYMRNDDFDAYQWEPSGTAKSKTELRQNQFGGSLGGPILKNKAFFFGDYQGWRQINGGLSKVLVPTPDEYSAIHAFAAGSGQSITFSDVWDAWGGDASTGSVVATQGGFTTPLGTVTNQMNPLGLAYLMEAPPSMCNPTCGSSTYNFYGASNTVQNSDTYDARIDYHFNDKNKLFGRFSYNNTVTTTPGPYPPEKIVNGSSKTYAENTSPNPVLTDNIAVDWVHIFSPSTLFEAKAGYMRMNEEGYTSGFKTWTLGDISSNYACGATDGFCYNSSGIGGLPWLQFSGPSPSSPYGKANSGVYMFNGFQGDGGLTAYTENTFQYNASLTLNRKSHSIKIGVGLIRRQVNAPDNSNDQITYSANYTGNALADMFEGLALEVTGSKFLVEHRGRMWEPSAYIQDDWRVTKALTLNLGVRYDIYTPMTDRFGNVSNFNFNTGLVVSPQLQDVSPSNGASFNTSPTGGINTDYSNLAPRVGFAYSFGSNSSVLKNMVLRGGFGMSYFPANSGTPGGLHQYELLNAPFAWAMGCGAAGTGQTLCDQTAYANGGHAYAVPAGQYVYNGADYGEGGYNLQYGLPLALYDTALATDPANYASSLPGDVFIPSNYKSSYLYQYNLQLQKQIGNNIVTAGFVGNLSRRNNSLNNLNQPPVPLSPGDHYPMYSAATSWMDGVPVETVIAGGNASWTAGEATYERRLTSGFSASVNYTWARSEGQGTGQSECVVYGCQMDNGSGTPIIVNGWKQYNYSGSTSNRAAGMLSYIIPFGKNLHGVEGAVLKGWELNGTGNWNTGPWSTITMSANRSQINGYSYLADNGNASEYPNRVPGVSVKPHHQTISNWINPAAFSLQTLGMLGNAKNPDVQGPRSRDADLGMVKTFSLLEGFKLQFRADAFNFTNTPSYDPPPPGGPGGGGGTTEISVWNCPGSPTTSSCPAGTLATSGGGFGTITGVTSQPRVFQFALKLIY